jgi:hypothetical protein
MALDEVLGLIVCMFLADAMFGPVLPVGGLAPTNLGVSSDGSVRKGGINVAVVTSRRVVLSKGSPCGGVENLFTNVVKLASWHFFLQYTF